MNDDHIQKKVQALYNDYRTTLLSKKYYAHRLEVVKRWSFVIEFCLAISASSSFASLKLDALAPCLPYLTAGVAILAILKPLLGLDKQIERLSKLTASFSELFERTKRLVTQISIDEAISDASLTRLDALQSSADQLASIEDMKPSRRLLEKFQAEVDSEIPVDSLWWPVRGKRAANAT